MTRSQWLSRSSSCSGLKTIGTTYSMPSHGRKAGGRIPITV
jgi:hypothetical protein